MATVTYNFVPDQDVYVINTCNGNAFVEAGTIIRVNIDVLLTGTTIKYDVRIGNNTGTKVFNEEDIFVDKATALTEYETRV